MRFRRTPKRVTVELYYEDDKPLIYLKGKNPNSPEVEFVTQWMRDSTRYILDHPERVTA